MTGHINSLTTGRTTTATDLANTFGQDTAKLYAKQTDQGVVLYSKTGSKASDKFLLTKGPDGSIMTKAKAKKMLAQETVTKIVTAGVKKRINDLGRGPGAIDSDIVKQMRALLTRNIRDHFAPGLDAQTTVYKAKAIRETGAAVLDRLEKIAQEKAQGIGLVVKPQVEQMPPTTSREVPGPTLTVGRATLPSLDVGGKVYEPVKVLGEATNVVVL